MSIQRFSTQPDCTFILVNLLGTLLTVLSSGGKANISVCYISTYTFTFTEKVNLPHKDQVLPIYSAI